MHKKLNRAIALFGVILVLFSLFQTVFLPSIANAYDRQGENGNGDTIYKGNFIDRTRVKSGDTILELKNPYNGELNVPGLGTGGLGLPPFTYIYQHSNGCVDTLTFNKESFKRGSGNINGGNTSELYGELTIERKVNQDCVPYTHTTRNNFVARNRGMRHVLAYKINDKIIWMPNPINFTAGFLGIGLGDPTGEPREFWKEQDGDSYFYWVGDDGETDNYDDGGGARISLKSSNTLEYQYKDGSCWTGCTEEADADLDEISNLLYFTDSPPNSEVYPDAPSADDEPGSGGGGQEDDNSCESTSGPLGWIMCPIAGLLDSVTGWLDTEIVGLLTVEDSVFSDKGGDALKTAWSRLRNIAYTILIPIMLVMVIGTALNMEVFSAYTVKKALPRMVIAIIFIALSWHICMFLNDLTNVVGYGIKGIVTSPFNVAQGNRGNIQAALDAAQITSSGNGNWQDLAEGITTVTAFGGAAIAAWAAGALSLSVIMSTLVSAVLVLGIVFLILVARQMFIIAFMLLAPLAILSWIFPGNDKLWKLWWTSFSKLLMMFPFVMLLIGVGQAFAMVIGQARIGENRLVTSIMIIAAIIVPYAAIPFTFKWAGGVFGNLAGMVNDKNKGILDRLKKGRAESRSQGWNKFKSGTGTGFAQQNKLTRRVGTGISAGIGGGKGVFGTGFTKAQRARGQARMDQLNRQNAVDQVMKSDAWNGVNQDDSALHAGILLQDMGKDAAIRHMVDEMGMSDNEAKRAVSAWQASGLGGRAAAIAAAQQLVSTGTGYKRSKDSKYGSDLEFMSKTLARASGGNSSTATAMAGFANSEAKKTGRGDLAPSFGVLNGLVQEELGTTPSRPTQWGYSQQIVKSSRAQDAVTLLRGKTQEVEEFAGALTSHLTEQHRRSQDATLTADQRKEATNEMLRTAAQIEQLNQSKSYASDDNKVVINKLMDETDIIRTGGLRGGAAGPVDPTSVRGRIVGDPQIAEQWDRLNPRARNPNDPNLPE